MFNKNLILLISFIFILEACKDSESEFDILDGGGGQPNIPCEVSSFSPTESDMRIPADNAF